MKAVFTLLLVSASFFSTAQQIDFNHQKGYIAGGYDVVAYFTNKALKGSTKYEYRFQGAKYKFSSQANLETFKSNPEKYIPQYGVWCAYAMADKGEKVSVNPKTFEIRDGKLFLFYNAIFDNTFESWLEQKPKELIKKADANWSAIKFKSWTIYDASR